MVKIILKKWRKPQALKNCRYLKVKDTKSGEEKMYGYKPKLEIAVLEKGSDGKPFYDILGFFDKDEKKIKVDIKELLKINYDTLEVKPKKKIIKKKTVKKKVSKKKVIKKIKPITDFEDELKQLMEIYDEVATTERIREIAEETGYTFGKVDSLVRRGYNQLIKNDEEIKKQEKEDSKKTEVKIEDKKYIEHKTKSGALYNFIKRGKFGLYVDIDAVVEAMRDEYDFVTIYGKTNEEIWIYDEGIYKPNGRELIESYAETLLNTWAKTKVVNEIVKKIKRQTQLDREEFDKIPSELIPLSNGVLNFKTNEFTEYSPKYYFKSKLNANYNQDATYEEFENFINQTLYPDDINVMQEWFGYCLFRRYLIKKGIIFVGERDTGKTLVLNILTKFIGNENIAGISLQRITSNDKFAIASLYNKQVNSYDDLSSKDVNDGGGFKIATGGGYITAEVKFGDPFRFINFAKMTFACNRIPPIKDLDDLAYYHRWMPLQFDNIVSNEEQDLYLIDKLTTKENLSGILNWALKGLKRLLEQGRFSYNKSPEEIKRIMDRSGNPLSGFAQDFLIEGDKKITKEMMYQLYSSWVKENKLTRLSKEQLGRQLPKVCSYILAKREKERFWDGIEIDLKINSFIDNLDTSDTFKKTYIEQGLYYNPRLYKNEKKVSKASLDNNKKLDDTSDTFSKNEKKMPEWTEEEKKRLEEANKK